ncbi:Ral guanine nucleotide dissociation stimulator-like 1 [Trichinella pseudospiralis]|uniref:Ral guanine nucleotide dissociation stimulator-like 1 n=2 Tax=Trichinella pseudospiralis TaxID=6337 RepID=A0A0V1HI44_TRIPS|nr:Ral guanine nucleotide dissociation stimulator-like 1 [Trichinella pseudospiralis]
MTSRYWGEEKQADVHYEVYLKKVCYHSDGRHWKSHQNAKLSNCAVAKSRLNVLRYNLFNGWSDRDVDDDRLEWETIKIRVIKAATLQKWVLDMVLIEDDCARGYLFELFFETYRAVATPIDVLRIILSDLKTLLNDNGRVRRAAQCQWKFQTWCTVLRRWLSRYPEDFDEYPKYTCLCEILEFSRKNNDVLDLVAEKATTMRSQFTRQFMLPKCKSCFSFMQNGLLSHVDMLDYVGNCTMSRHLDLTHMDPLYIAEQLTCIDADLFKRLICYQCQSYFWSRRFKSSSASDCVNTVRATVDQFNALARRVMSSVVYNIHEKAYYRAKVICCWILVAQELRSLKNFNSLKAILSALQSEPVYRLRSAWSLVSSDMLDFFQELSRVFGEDDNSAAIRSLLLKEGTSKTAVGVGAKTRRVKLKRYRRTASCDMLEVRGTVPYLGTFLTDLSMIDTAFSDFTSEGLINVDKRRREYDVIGQVKLIQKNVKYYRIKMDPKFWVWFRALPDLDEKLCYDLSCCIEPTKEECSISCSKICSQLFSEDEFSNSSSGSPNRVTNRRRCSQLLSAVKLLDRSIFYQPLKDDNESGTTADSAHGSGASSINKQRSPVDAGADCYIVRVTLEKSLQGDVNYETLYKSVKLENCDRTRDLIKKALAKHNVNASADQFSIVQILPDGKQLQLPEQANAFYAAANRMEKMTFMLKKRELGSTPSVQRSDSRMSSNLSRWSSTGTLAFV